MCNGAGIGAAVGEPDDAVKGQERATLPKRHSKSPLRALLFAFFKENSANGKELNPDGCCRSGKSVRGLKREKARYAPADPLPVRRRLTTASTTRFKDSAFSVPNFGRDQIPVGSEEFSGSGIAHHL